MTGKIRKSDTFATLQYAYPALHDYYREDSLESTGRDWLHQDSNYKIKNRFFVRSQVNHTSILYNNMWHCTYNDVSNIIPIKYVYIYIACYTLRNCDPYKSS